LITVPRTLVVLAWLTLVLQFALCIQGPLGRGEGIWPGVDHYFGYFTILTNGLCALVMTSNVYAGWRGRFATFLRRPGVATSAAGSILLVATVYHAVLRTTWMPEGMYLFTDLMLHTLLPMGYLAFWWTSVPRGALSMRDIPRWISWPGLYTVYAFTRGAITGTYPYFFVDVPTIGYLASVRNTLVILVGFMVICAALVGVNRVAGLRMRLEA
jgi:hypothetical protein